MPCQGHWLRAQCRQDLGTIMPENVCFLVFSLLCSPWWGSCGPAHPSQARAPYTLVSPVQYPGSGWTRAEEELGWDE